MAWFEKTVLVLAAIGAINWAFVTFDWNLVEKLLLSWAGSTTVTIIYWVIALSGLYALVKAFQ